MENLFYLVPISSLIALLFAFLLYRYTTSQPAGDENMIRIKDAIREGAIAYLKRQYKTVSIFFVFAALFFAFLAFVLKIQSPWVPFAFLTGGFFSGLCGFLGMMTSTGNSSRVTEAAKKSLNSALKIAFNSGAVMGLLVVGLGLLDIAIWFTVLRIILRYDLFTVTTTMLAFGIGASSQALFARVGGGIYTKAADVGADLVGKVEEGIPEDDPRNPAVIADNVGDNVGDVAGMGADLYESYVGSILAAMVLGVTAGLGLKGVFLPMLIASLGIISSLIGIFLVRSKEEATQKNLLDALSRGINFSSFLIVLGSGLIIYFFLPNHLGLFGSILSGLGAGIIIGKSSEYFTSSNFKPVKELASQSKGGPATVILEGLSLGMNTTFFSILTVAIATLLAFGLAGGFKDPSLGLYGIGIAAVGMLSTLGITLASDAYGPIADNAGGNAQMTGQPEEVRKRTDALDALGNTTAAIGKGFAIGSAALTALTLIAAYFQEVIAALERIGVKVIQIGEKLIPLAEVKFTDLIYYYQIHLLNPKVITGLFLGVMVPFFFCSFTLKAVGRAAADLVEEVRRQWREIKGIMTGEVPPNYGKAVDIATKAAQREMIFPSLMAVIFPIIIGLILGVSGVVGFLIGALASGFAIAIMMANSGAAWDNAKKYIEAGNLGGKGSLGHKASVIGDTVGDPFKDTAGPSLNILIKLMAMASIVTVGLAVLNLIHF